MELNDSQIEAVSYGEGPLLITAGAGSGKTRTLTQRVAHLIQEGTPADRILAITFTNKAADEMKKRIAGELIKSGLGKGGLPFVGTFHAFSAHILRKEAKKAGRDYNYIIFDDGDSKKVIRQIIKSLNFDENKRITPLTARKEISKIKIGLSDLGDVDPKIRLIYEEYEKSLKNQNAFDFDDLITKVVRIFIEQPGTLKKHQDRFDYILVDEYQDINKAQYELVSLLAQNHGNINVVGDDQQSIYAFRGASIETFIGFEKQWPKTKIVHLGENYRSTKNIVNAAAGVIKNNRFQIPKDLWTKNPEGSPVRVIAARSSSDESDIISEKILSGGFRESAILYRTNAQSRAIEQSLNYNSIPYEIYGGVRFYERKEIKDILAPLRYALNPKDKVSEDRINKTFKKAVREELKEKLPGLAKQLGLMELIGYVLKTTDYFTHLNAKFENSADRNENVQELISYAATFEDLSEFIEKVSLLESSEKIADKLRQEGSKDAIVKLMTIHLAKGLEFDDVYIAGTNEGILPHQRSYFREADPEEERRLMYVAMTRARNNLFISFYGLASRFLYEIPPELVKFNVDDGLEETIYLD